MRAQHATLYIIAAGLTTLKSKYQVSACHVQALANTDGSMHLLEAANGLPGLAARLRFCACGTMGSAGTGAGLGLWKTNLSCLVSLGMTSAVVM